MAKVQHFQSENAAAPVQPLVSVEQPTFIADDTVHTVYGMTLGEIMQDATVNITRLTDESTAKDTEIARLTAELAEAVKAKPRVFTDAEIQQAMKADPEGLKKLPDGSISVRVIVPEEAALPLLSWAESAGEAAEMYIQKTLAEALVAYTAS